MFFNITSSLFILIAVILTVFVFISLIGWWRGADNVLFPGLGLVVAVPAIIVFLLILTGLFVIIAAAVKPRTCAPAQTMENFEYSNDIFSGCGNGTLGLSVSMDPNNYNLKTDRFLKICINDADLTAIRDFVISSEMRRENLENSQSFQQANEQSQKTFRKFAAAYPMLGKIDDLYQDYVFNVEEIRRLRGECLKLHSQKPVGVADLALRKFIYACDEALRENFYLMFGSD